MIAKHLGRHVLLCDTYQPTLKISTALSIRESQFANFSLILKPMEAGHY